MKKQFIGIIVLLVLLTSCGQNPFSPEVKVRVAKIVLAETMVRTYTSYNCPVFTGYVKNTGDATGYNVKVAITCFSDDQKKTIIDVANGFPANLGDIGPGQRAYFEAVVFGCDSWDDIKGWTVKITWLDR